jgi:hypothetical protein
MGLTIGQYRVLGEATPVVDRLISADFIMISSQWRAVRQHLHVLVRQYSPENVFCMDNFDSLGKDGSRGKQEQN